MSFKMRSCTQKGDSKGVFKLPKKPKNDKERDDKPLVRAACDAFSTVHCLFKNRKLQSCRQLLFLEFRIQESKEDVRVSQR